MLEDHREERSETLGEFLTGVLRNVTGDGEIKYDSDSPVGGLPVIPPDERRKAPVYSDECYICRDPEFAMYGLPLCRACPFCGGHVAADDSVCDVCGRDEMEYYRAQMEAEAEGNRE